MERAVIIGSGNLAEALARAVTKSGLKLVQLFARNAARGQQVAALAGTQWTSDPAGLAEADGTIPLAVLDQEFRIDFLKDFHARLDGVEPLVELGFAVAESGLHEEADKGFAGVVGFVGAERRHEMVVAAAEAAGAFQPPLPHHEHVGLKFRRAQGCTDT